jgi:hypothetical protein
MAAKEVAMTDPTTNKPLRVSGDGGAIPYLMVPLKQLEEVRRLLDGRGIGYWVEETAISLGGRPAVAFINFQSGAEGKKAQEVLDGAA